MDGHSAFPLHWPEHQARTPRHRRERPRFKTSFARARDNLIHELDRLGARYPVLSTNVSLRLDGLPLANQSEPDDPGVAVYFELNGKQMCFTCDRWDRVQDNIHAISLTIDAMRGIERWGSSSMLNRMYSAFEQLPAPGKSEHWRDVLGVRGIDNIDAVKREYRSLVQIHHPDRGGDTQQFMRIQNAWDQAQRELGA